MPPFPTSVHRYRLTKAAAEAGSRGLDALLVTPSSDYLYLLRYAAPPLELTCLIVRPDTPPTLVLPHLEEPLAPIRLVIEDAHMGGDRRSLCGGRGGSRPPYEWLSRTRCGPGSCCACGRRSMGPTCTEAGPALNALRRTKSPQEIERLRTAAEAADRAMDAITSQKLSGRTEAAVSIQIRELLRSAGHDTADWAIVASGPNAASPHHTPGSV